MALDLKDLGYDHFLFSDYAYNHLLTIISKNTGHSA